MFGCRENVDHVPLREFLIRGGWCQSAAKKMQTPPPDDITAIILAKSFSEYLGIQRNSELADLARNTSTIYMQ